MRYVDDTLLLVKPKDADRVLNLFNSFDPKIQFTVDKFIDGNIHFLDLQIKNNNLIDIYRKDTFTGQYTGFDSFEPWNLKIGWIRSLVNRCSRLCTTDQSKNQQFSTINKLMSYNGFPQRIRRALLARFRKAKDPKACSQEDSFEEIFIRLPYLGKEGEQIVRKCISRLKRCIKSKVNFKVFYRTSKISMFCSNKDKIATHLKSNVIYKFDCPGCRKSYVGKTDRNFITRVNEHGTKHDQNSAIYSHLLDCDHFHFIYNLLNIENNDKSPSTSPYILETVKDNTIIVAENHDWSQLCFLEALLIKKYAPDLNDGLKSSKSLKLFD